LTVKRLDIYFFSDVIGIFGTSAELLRDI